MKLVTAAQMREMDRTTIEDYGLPGIVLMENAGRAVAEAALRLLPESGGRVLVLAGKGNNGGDGLVAARHLAGEGLEVAVMLFCAAEDLRGDAAINCQYARRVGLTVIEEPDDEVLLGALELADVVIDALLGTGVRGEVTGRLREVIELLEECAAPVVAVDLPSGLDADTGAVLGAAVEADVTVTFGFAKAGLVQYPGRAYCGELQVANIGLPPVLGEYPTVNTYLTEASDCELFLPHRSPDAHKGDAGRVLIVAGSPGLTGAAVLAGNGAARAGAGLVTVGVPQPLQPVVAAKLTEVMTLGLPAAAEGALGPEALPELLGWVDRVDAVALGPGLSQQPGVAELVLALVQQLTVPLVLDADALNALVGHTDALRARSGETVVTPHPGELSRLMGLSIAEIQADRLAAARSAATELGCVVVLKGAATVVADPSGDAWINSTGNPGMASGGMGDVLTGVIAALLAGGARPLEAAVAGVYLHGLAGDLAAADLGPRGFLAGDLLERLPAAYARLLDHAD
ncbi:MAG: NAD(P)H-hydrate dehydratase [Armatimonadetes bacterium]|nr:NAD(P)H-hydrate dehydratase [Armatimonadota bacterium]